MEGRKKIKVGEIRESVFQLSLDKKRLDIIKSANFTHRLNSASRKAKTTKFEIVAPPLRPVKMRISREEESFISLRDVSLSSYGKCSLIEKLKKNDLFGLAGGGHGGNANQNF